MNQMDLSKVTIVRSYDRFRAFYKGRQVGYANTVVKKNSATLGDIKIDDKYPLPTPWYRRKQSINFQNQGVGTLLLKHVIRELSLQGVDEIKGKIAGDYARLASWYRRHGFTVDGIEITWRNETSI